MSLHSVSIYLWKECVLYSKKHFMYAAWIFQRGWCCLVIKFIIAIHKVLYAHLICFYDTEWLLLYVCCSCGHAFCKRLSKLLMISLVRLILWILSNTLCRFMLTFVLNLFEKLWNNTMVENSHDQQVSRDWLKHWCPVMYVKIISIICLCVL